MIESSDNECLSIIVDKKDNLGDLQSDYKNVKRSKYFIKCDTFTVAPPES